MLLPRVNGLCVLVVASALLSACPGPVISPGGDASVASDAGGGPADVLIRGTAPLFAPCATDNDCLNAAGVTCLADFPGGLCSRRCDTDTDCGARGVCIANLCLVECGLGSDACGPIGGACERYADPVSDAPESYCVASCTPEDLLAPGAQGCGNGLFCDAHTGSCEVPPFPTGLENGAPCTDSTLCLGGSCELDTVVQGVPTGFIGGYCFSFARQPSDADLVPGGPMPRSNCPLGSVVLPIRTEAGDYVACYRSCTTDTDCRAGYACDFGDDFLQQHYSTGVCLPFDCSQPGRACPSGSVCSMTNGSFLHPVCIPPTTAM